MLTMNAACKIWRTQVHKSQSEKEYKNFQNFIKLNLLKFRLMKKNFSHSGFVFSKWLIFSWSNQHLRLCWHILWWGTEVCWQGDLAARLCPQTRRTWRFLEWESQMGPSWSCRLWSMWSFLGRKPSNLLLSCWLTRNVTQHSQLQALSHRWCHPHITERPRSVTITLLHCLLWISWCCHFAQYLPYGAME